MTKRAFFEWVSIAALTVSVSSFVVWGFSKNSSAADFSLLFDYRDIQISVSDSTVTLCDHFDNLQMVEFHEAWLPSNLPRSVKSRYGWAAPGFQFRCITFVGDPPSFRMKCSLLIPACLAMVVAVICFFRYRRIMAGSAA